MDVITKKRFPPGHFGQSVPLYMLGSALLGQNKPREALPLLRSSLAIVEKAKAGPAKTALAEYAIARALAAMGPHYRARAIAMGKRARANFARLDGPLRTREEKVLDKFLAEQARK